MIQNDERRDALDASIPGQPHSHDGASATFKGRPDTACNDAECNSGDRHPGQSRGLGAGQPGMQPDGAHDPTGCTIPPGVMALAEYRRFQPAVRLAFSSMPDNPSRRISSASTS